MRVEQLGDGEPTLAVVGSIHGDEPCGEHAIETILRESPSLDRPVKFIIANERALDRGVRYTEADMNRVFPGDPTAPAYERRLAADLLRELRGCTALSMHSTQSYDRPFAILETARGAMSEICPSLSIDTIVETGGFIKNTLVGYADVVEVECGRQGSAEAKANAVQLVREFLKATGAWPASETITTETPVYRLQRQIPKDRAQRYAVHVDNFERVHKGTRYASMEGRELRAEDSFYPVLMSANGYESQLGYAARLAGYLDENGEFVTPTEVSPMDSDRPVQTQRA